MPKCLKFYKDKKKALAYRNRQRAINYSKSDEWAEKHPWTKSEDIMVLERKTTDFELSKIIKHSIRAIQIRRSKLKRKYASK